MTWQWAELPPAAPPSPTPPHPSRSWETSKWWEYGTAGVTMLDYPSNAYAQTGCWQHLVVTKSAASIMFYANGVLINNQANPAPGISWGEPGASPPQWRRRPPPAAGCHLCMCFSGPCAFPTHSALPPPTCRHRRFCVGQKLPRQRLLLEGQPGPGGNVQLTAYCSPSAGPVQRQQAALRWLPVRLARRNRQRRNCAGSSRHWYLCRRTADVGAPCCNAAASTSAASTPSAPAQP